MAIAASRIQHVGIAVRDMQRSLRFYREVFAVEPDFVYRSPRSSRLDAALGVEDAELRIAVLDIGGTQLELLEYGNPDRDTTHERRNCDVGAAHVCFEVDDISSAYEELRSHGVEFLSAPLRIDEGPLEGWTFCYFEDPDGVTLELLEAPGSP